MARHPASMRWIRRRPLFAAALLVTCGAATARALEVRNPESAPRYSADLTRGYAPCLVPNDQTSDGIPACSPVATSACTFNRGSVDVRPRGNAEQTRLDVVVRDIAGPGTCTSGTYTLQLGLRVTADDPACDGGVCTFEDLVVSQPLDADPPDDLELHILALETFLPGGLTGAHYQVLGATILAPDGLPMAATGMGTNSAIAILTTSGAGYEVCGAPDTSGALGDACSPPTWPSGCDTNGGNIRWRDRSTRGFQLDVNFSDITGLAPECRNGTFTVVTSAQVTTGPCVSSALCTTVEHAFPIDTTSKNGTIDAAMLQAGFGTITTPVTSVEIHGITMLDAAAETFATSAVSGALRLDKAKVSMALHDLLDPNDDHLRLEGRFPFVAIDPTAVPGVTFTVTDRNGPIYQVTIPNAQWQLVAPIGTRWEFLDPAGGIGGVRKASIKQFSQAGEPAGYKIKLFAKNVDLSAADLPGVNLLISIPPPGGFSQTTAQRNRTCKVGAHSFACR